MNYSGITTNPYAYILGMAKGDLKQLIWGGLLFDPHSHNPQSPMPVGQIMRMNVLNPFDDNEKALHDMCMRAEIFIQGLDHDRTCYINFLNIDTSEANIEQESYQDLYNSFIQWKGGKGLYEGDNPYPRPIGITFDDGTFETGILHVKYPYADYQDYQVPVTFGENAEIDEILNQSYANINKPSIEGSIPFWPVFTAEDGFKTLADMPRLAFQNFQEGTISPGENVTSVSIRGVGTVESLILDSGETVTPSYHGEDGDSFFVEAMIYRNWDHGGFLAGKEVVPEKWGSWLPGYGVYDYAYPDAHSVEGAMYGEPGRLNIAYLKALQYHKLILELYPNVSYIQNAPVWMTVRNVWMCVDVVFNTNTQDYEERYKLISNENDRDSMPFIFGGQYTPEGRPDNSSDFNSNNEFNWEGFTLAAETAWDYNWANIGGNVNTGGDSNLCGRFQWNIGSKFGSIEYPDAYLDDISHISIYNVNRITFNGTDIANLTDKYTYFESADIGRMNDFGEGEQFVVWPCAVLDFGVPGWIASGTDWIPIASNGEMSNLCIIYQPAFPPNEGDDKTGIYRWMEEGMEGWIQEKIEGHGEPNSLEDIKGWFDEDGLIVRTEATLSWLQPWQTGNVYNGWPGPVGQ